MLRRELSSRERKSSTPGHSLNDHDVIELAGSDGIFLKT